MHSNVSPLSVMNVKEILSALDDSHPLKQHEESITKFHSKLGVSSLCDIPYPGTESETQAFACFVMIHYLGKVRFLKLTEASILLASENNTYALSQVVRATMENSAWLGHALHLTGEWPPIKEAEPIKRLLYGSHFDVNEKDTCLLYTSDAADE